MRPGWAPSHAPDAYWQSARRYLLAGAATTAVLVFGVGGWATTTEIAGAIVASGSLVVESNVKKVQHPTGGVVGELPVQDGDYVREGQVVVRLDATQARANLAIVTSALDELAARVARETAEQSGEDAVRFPEDLVRRAVSETAVDRLLKGEAHLFRTRLESRNGQKAQLRERIGQLKQEAAGLRKQADAKTREIALIHEELTGVKVLWSKKLVQLSRVTSLERDAARTEGEFGQLEAQIAQVSGKTTETELQILQVDQDLRTEVGKDLAETRAKVSELSEKKVAAEDLLRRVDIRAPQSGTVYQMAVHTVGGVVSPGEPIMLIVPKGDMLEAEIRIQPQDIDQLHVGQVSAVRFTSFNQRTTPQLAGVVKTISADAIQDQKTGASFYTARITLERSEIKKLGDVHLVPGMPVEVFAHTGNRTVISYLTKPLVEQVERAWRER